MAIKHSLGKLRLLPNFSEFMTAETRRNRIMVHPISLADAVGVADLPFHSRDPFDRLLVAHCLAQNWPIVSADASLDAYGIRRIWS